MVDTPGMVILLVGPSCAGKSTLADAIQKSSVTPYLIQSLDGLFAATPDAYGGSGEHARLGFRYDWPAVENDGATPVRRIAYGPVGWQLLKGFHRAVAAYSSAGINVVVDDMLIDLPVLEDWALALVTIPTLLVNVTAARDDLLQRELARTRRSTPGLVEGHFGLHRRILADLEIDTSAYSPDRAASAVLSLATSGSSFNALRSFRPAEVR